jgi:hypothetical protein
MQSKFSLPIFILTIFSLLFFSCSTSVATPPPLDPATEKFSMYLKLNFEDSIPNTRHLYVLISKKDSRENVSKILSRLNVEMGNKKPETYSSIVSVNMPIDDSMMLPGKIHTDWNGAIDKLNLNLSSVTLIQTENNKIADILPLSVDSSGMEKQFLKW